MGGTEGCKGREIVDLHDVRVLCLQLVKGVCDVLIARVVKEIVIERIDKSTVPAFIILC